jgi:NADH-quinone oxidoreductase subunit L
MFVAAGLGAVFAARFHLIAHALFKATLFLAAGSVMHATADELDIGRLGGLGRRMRWTAGAFAIGTLALAAIPPVSGFFSKEGIAASALADNEPFLLGVVLVTSFVSAFYAARVFVLVFVAPPAVERDAHESPAVMVVPVVLLALGALVFGGLVASGLLPIGSGRPDEAPLWLVAVSFAIALAGFSIGWLTYRHGLARAAPVEGVTARLANGFGIDRLYERAFRGPFELIGRELEHGAERVNQRAVDGIGSVVAASSSVIRRAQSGYVRGYELLLLAGAVVLLLYWSWGVR